MILKWFNFLFSFVTVLKSLLKNRNWIHKLFSPSNQIHFSSSSKMNSLPPTLAVFLSSPGTNHCVSTILNDRRAEWKRSTVRRPQCQHSPKGKYQGRLEWPYLIFQTKSLLDFSNKNTNPELPPKCEQRVAGCAFLPLRELHSIWMGKIKVSSWKRKRWEHMSWHRSSAEHLIQHPSQCYLVSEFPGLSQAVFTYQENLHCLKFPVKKKNRTGGNALRKKN